MQRNPITIFLSYANEDSRWVKSLKARLLERSHFKVWLDSVDLKPGDPVPETVENGLRDCDVFIGVVTVHYAGHGVRSNWTAAQLGAVRALRKFTLSVIDETIPWEQVPGTLKRGKYVRKRDPTIVADEIGHILEDLEYGKAE